MGTIDRLEDQPIFAAAPLLWPGVLFVVATAYERAHGLPRPLGAILDSVNNACSRLEADYTVARGQCLTSGPFKRSLEQAIRDEFAAPPRSERKATINLDAWEIQDMARA